MKKTTTKPRNPNESTMRNVRKSRSEAQAIRNAILKLAARVTALEDRLR